MNNHENPIACLMSYIANSPELRRYLNYTHKGIDSDSMDLCYESFKGAYDYCEEEVTNE